MSTETTDTATTADTTTSQTTDTTATKTADTTTSTATTDTTQTSQTTDATKTSDTTTTDATKAVAAWPEDWRQKLSNGDEKMMKRLERFASPAAVWQSYEEAQKKISSGQLKQPLKENATAEELKAWRADNGIPETAEGYDTNLGDGHVWGDNDKPLLESFTKAAHEANLSPDAVKPMLKWYQALQDQVEEGRQNADAQYKKDNVDKLIAEYGTEFRRNVRLADEFFDAMPDGLGQLFREARGADGRLLFANEALIRWAVSSQLASNPIATVMGGGKDSVQAMAGEIADIEAKMKDFNSDYYKGEKVTKNGRTDTKMALRYYELMQAKERVGGKQAA